MLRSIFLGVVCCLSFTYAAAQKNIRLLSYNVRNAKGMDNKLDYDRTAAVIKNAKADIIALQELDSVTQRNSDYVLKVLAEKTGLFYVYGAAIPYQGGKYGVGILSKKKPSHFYTTPLPGKGEERVLLVAEFKKYVVFCTHLSLTSADRQASIALINEQADKFKKPVYLLGDLNDEPGGPAITSLKNRWTLLSGEEATFPAPVPRKCLDYVFVLNDKKTKVISTVVVNEPMASDHRPVLVEVGKR